MVISVVMSAMTTIISISVNAGASAGASAVRDCWAEGIDFICGKADVGCDWPLELGWAGLGWAGKGKGKGGIVIL